MDTREIELHRQRVGALFTAARDGDVDRMLSALAAFDSSKSGGAAAAVLACRDANRRTALHFAANQGHSKCIKALIAVAGDKKALVDATDSDGATALMMAVLGDSKGALECIDALIAAGTDLSLYRKKQRDTALHIAARNGHVEAARKLVEAGADLTAHSVVGTPLHEAACEGETAVIDLLINAIHAQHCSHTDSAEAKGRVAKLWLEAKSSKGVTPLLLAAANRHEDASVQLTEAGSPLAVTADRGLTALHIMAESGHTEAVAAAVRRAARVPVADTPASTSTGTDTASSASASASGTGSGDDTAEDDAGRAMGVVNSDGLLPIQLAAAGGHTSIVESMWEHSSSHLSADGATTPSALIEAEQAKRAAEAASIAEEAPPAPEAASASTTATDALEAEADSFVRPDGETSAEDAAAAQEKKARGNDAFKEGNAAEAEALYSEAIALDPRAAVMRLNRSAARLTLRKHMAALSDAVIARRLDDKSAKACYREGVARMALGQFEEAAVALFEGTKLDPHNKAIERKFKEAVRKGQVAHKAEEAAKDAENRARRLRAQRDETLFRASLRALKSKTRA